MRRTIQTDLVGNDTTYTLSGDGGEFGGSTLARIEAIDLELGYSLLRRYRIIADDPLSAQCELLQKASLRRGDWSVQLECRTRLAATATDFQFSCSLAAQEGDEPVLNRDWDVAIPRRLV